MRTNLGPMVRSLDYRGTGKITAELLTPLDKWGVAGNSGKDPWTNGKDPWTNGAKLGLGGCRFDEWARSLN